MRCVADANEACTGNRARDLFAHRKRDDFVRVPVNDDRRHVNLFRVGEYVEMIRQERAGWNERALRRAAAELRGTLGARWPLLVQGDASRDLLLRRFREAGNAILLGTDSFWEGVDVPGRALRALVLHKLPFKVPSEPITAARLERLAEQGADGFTSYLLPHAALKLKQGFGRLIRTRTDVGVVILLDRRVVVKRYGPLLLSGLPKAERVMGSWAEVRTKCEDFFARHGIGASV